MQRLATIILPTLDNKGQSLALVQDWLEIKLLDTFGGYTAYPVIGAWRNDKGKTFRDHNIKYEIAIDAFGCGFVQLEVIAQELCRLADQEAIFLTDPDGIVSFVVGPSMADA